MSDNVEREDGEPQSHPTSVALSRAPAAEIDAGTEIVLKVRVSCPYGCDLREWVINVLTTDGVVVGGSRLAEFADHVNETTEFAFMAPDEVGEYSWTVVFPKQQAEALCTRKPRFRLRSGRWPTTPAWRFGEYLRRS